MTAAGGPARGAALGRQPDASFSLGEGYRRGPPRVAAGGGDGRVECFFSCCLSHGGSLHRAAKGEAAGADGGRSGGDGGCDAGDGLPDGECNDTDRDGFWNLEEHTRGLVSSRTVTRNRDARTRRAYGTRR